MQPCFNLNLSETGSFSASPSTSYTVAQSRCARSNSARRDGRWSTPRHISASLSLLKQSDRARGQALRCGAVTSLASTAASAPTAIAVAVEKSPNNSRRLFAEVDIDAPPAVVWKALTDYDRLHTFIPSLAENRCLERRPNGARLLQVGAQEVALGVKFCARVVLDIFEFGTGLPDALCSRQHDESKFPLPSGFGNGSNNFAAAGGGTPVELQDIAFRLVEGDFQAFQGLWRMAPGSQGPCTTRLSYALFVRPQVWLPVRLIQSRIEGEVKNNLTAVRSYTESLHYQQQASSSSSSTDAGSTS